MRLEASTDADFATLVAGNETSATADVAADLSVQGLAPGTTYHLRVRLCNDWGFETFLPLPSVATPAVPLESTGIGYTWSHDGSTIDFTFGVSAVYDSATCTAELFYGGTPYGRRDFSGPGSLSWPNVPAASSARQVAVTVTDTAIEKVEVLAQNETAGLADPALQNVPSAIVEKQSLAVDTASGATVTSNAVLNAANTALAISGGRRSVRNADRFFFCIGQYSFSEFFRRRHRRYGSRPTLF